MGQLEVLDLLVNGILCRSIETELYHLLVGRKLL